MKRKMNSYNKAHRSQAQNVWSRPHYDVSYGIGELVGDLTNSGYLAQLRHTSPVVKSHSDALVAHFANSQWRLKMNKGSELGEPVAHLFRSYLAGIQLGFGIWTRLGWTNFVADYFDRMWTFGSAYYHRAWHHDEEQGYRLVLTPINHELITRFALSECRTKVDYITVQGESSYTTISGSDLLIFVDSTRPGDFYGSSPLRCLIGTFWQQRHDQKMFASNLSLARPVQVLKTIDAIDESDDSHHALVQAASDLASGDSDTLVLDHNSEFTKVGAANSNIQGVVDRWKYHDTIIREALGSLVSNLGLSGTGSNRALGEVLKVEDEDRWQATVARYVDLMAPLFDLFLERYELDEADLPAIQASSTSTKSLTEKLKDLKELKEVKDILPPEQFDLLLAESLGEADEEDSEDFLSLTS
jgi:hypothetical protein